MDGLGYLELQIILESVLNAKRHIGIRNETVHSLGEIKKAKEIGYKGTHQCMWVACEICGKERWVELKKGVPKSKLCLICATTNLEYRAKMSKMQIGEKGHNWRGGRIKQQGYIKVLIQPGNFFYPMANDRGYILEHRLVVAKSLGRCLQNFEIIHHLNGIREDNRIDNLAIVTAKCHPSKTFIMKLQTRIRELEHHLSRQTVRKIISEAE